MNIEDEIAYHREHAANSQSQFTVFAIPPLLFWCYAFGAGLFLFTAGAISGALP